MFKVNKLKRICCTLHIRLTTNSNSFLIIFHKSCPIDSDAKISLTERKGVFFC